MCADAHSWHGQRPVLTVFSGQTYILYLFMFREIIHRL